MPIRVAGVTIEDDLEEHRRAEAEARRQEEAEEAKVARERRAVEQRRKAEEQEGEQGPGNRDPNLGAVVGSHACHLMASLFRLLHSSFLVRSRPGGPTRHSGSLPQDLPRPGPASTGAQGGHGCVGSEASVWPRGPCGGAQDPLGHGYKSGHAGVWRGETIKGKGRGVWLLGF